MLLAEPDMEVTSTHVEELIARGLEPLHETLKRMETKLSQLAAQRCQSCSATGELPLTYSTDCATKPQKKRENFKSDSVPLLPVEKHLQISGAPSPPGESVEVRDDMSSFAFRNANETERSPRVDVPAEQTPGIYAERAGNTQAESQSEVCQFARAKGRNIDLRTIKRGKTLSEMEEKEGGHAYSRLIAKVLNPIWRTFAKLFKSKEPVREGTLKSIAESPKFEQVCAAAIITNSLFVAYTSDFEMKHLGQSPSKAVEAIEMLYVLFFAFELALRLLHHRLFFFINSDSKWNVLDFLLVILSLIETVFTYVMAASSKRVGNLSFIRLVRLLKLAKILRTLRVMRAFRDLSQILQSFRNCMFSLFWSFVMMGFVLYLFALVFIQGLTGYLIAGLETGESDDYDEIKDMFGSMPCSMLTLYKSATGGDDWANAYVVVSKAGTIYAIAFVFFTFFFSFALFNILTGVFVEKAVCAAQPDREEMIIEQQRKSIEEKAEFMHICSVLDVDQTGTISWAEFHEAMQNELMQSYMTSRGLQVRDVDICFELIVAQKGLAGADAADVQVKFDDFVDGCMAMRGMASSYDIAKFRFEFHEAQRSLKNAERRSACKLEQIASDLRRVEALLADVRVLRAISDTQVSTPRVSDVRAGSASL